MIQNEEVKSLLDQVVGNNLVHAKWLNTLSLMENSGARKIAAGEHPLYTDISTLQHASEEFRHAFYLKKQIPKTNVHIENYAFENLLNPVESYHYLHSLDVHISKYLKEIQGLNGRDLLKGAYILVTYAIEVRADSLYPVYENVLREQGSKITVRPLIFDEQGHLEEIQKQMKEFFTDWETVSEIALQAEEKLFQNWFNGIKQSMQTHN